jgi:hypothetical protein
LTSDNYIGGTADTQNQLRDAIVSHLQSVVSFISAAPLMLLKEKRNKAQFKQIHSMQNYSLGFN